MPKLTNAERATVKSIVATLSLKRVPESEIIKEIYEQTNKTIKRRSLYDLRQSIKRESFKWYKTMREGEYEYIHEFKERINEIHLKASQSTLGLDRVKALVEEMVK